MKASKPLGYTKPKNHRTPTFFPLSPSSTNIFGDKKIAYRHFALGNIFFPAVSGSHKHMHHGKVNALDANADAYHVHSQITAIIRWYSCCVWARFCCIDNSEFNPIGSTIDSMKNEPARSYLNPEIRFWLHYSYTKQKPKKKSCFFHVWMHALKMCSSLHQIQWLKSDQSVMGFLWVIFLMNVTLLSFDFTACKTTIENSQNFIVTESL